MRIVWCNERATPPMLSGKVRDDFLTIRSLVVTVVAWCEVTKWPHYRRLMRSIFGTEFRHVFMDKKNPFTVRKTWKVVAAGAERLTKGNALIPQPSRYTNWLMLERDGKLIILVLSHFTNGAFKRRFLNRKARYALWMKQFRETRVLIKWLMHTYPGVPIVGCGDYNNEDMDKFVAEQEWLAGQNNIAKAWIIDVDDKMHRSAHMERDVNTDHPLIIIDVTYA